VLNPCHCCRLARFLKRVQQTAEWEEVSEDTAREKASQVLRDAVAGLLEGKEEDEVPPDEVPHVQPLPTVSALVSTDEQDQASSRVRAVRSHADFHPPLPHGSESSDAKRRRYSTDVSNFHSFEERYSSQQVVGYSPIRRHSESGYISSTRSDPTSRRRSHKISSPHSAPGTTVRQQHQNLGNLDEFDLFNGELLESDLDDEGPLPPDTHSGAF
jgi:hypothetical protein